MKSIKLLSLIIVGALTFSSCKNNMSLTKRHYTKGYHFHKTKSVDQPEVKEGIASAPAKKAEKTSPIELVKVKPTTANATVAETKNTSANNQLTANATKTAAQTSKKQTNTEAKSLNETKQQLKNASKPKQESTNKGGGDSSSLKLILCIILAIFICPLGMYIWNKKTDIWFIVDLILFLLLFTYMFWSGGLVGLAAIVIALLRVFDII